MKKRGFAAMDREKVREIASRGGKAAHEQGVAHVFSPEEAKINGRKGGLKHGENCRARRAEVTQPAE